MAERQDLASIAKTAITLSRIVPLKIGKIMEASLSARKPPRPSRRSPTSTRKGQGKWCWWPKKNIPPEVKMKEKKRVPWPPLPLHHHHPLLHSSTPPMRMLQPKPCVSWPRAPRYPHILLLRLCLIWMILLVLRLRKKLLPSKPIVLTCKEKTRSNLRAS